MVGSHALLLRLFQSQSYFSVHLALQYLSTYHEHIGITHYITGRLRELDATELDDVWGFICHLLVTRPSKSCALETFVVERAEQSTHSALLTLWFMQAYLSDLSMNKRNTPSFVICQRVLLKVQNIIFSDPPASSSTSHPYGVLAPSSAPLSRFWKRKVKPRIGPALVGLGSVLAGAPGMPQLTMSVGPVAIEQGRVPDDTRQTRPFQNTEDDDMPHVSPVSSKIITATENEVLDSDNDRENDEESDEEEDVDTFGRTSTMSKLNIPPEIDQLTRPTSELVTQSVVNLSNRSGPALTRRQTLSAARTTPSLLRRTPSRGQTLDARSTSPSYSTPSLSFRTSTSMSYLPPTNPDLILSRIDAVTQSQMLQSHYCRSEVQFLLTLESISNRLLVVPKLARVSALRAELTALNHKLPAEVDIPMWTTDADSPAHTLKSSSSGHNRIVRIPPGESVVLNSAERAPYLLLVEVLVGELDFIPSKRANKDVLRRIVTKENKLEQQREKQRQSDESSMTIPRVSISTNGTHHQNRGSVGSVSFVDSPAVSGESEELPPIRPIPSRLAENGTSPFDGEEEEVDLVEQLYGTEISVRTHAADLSDSIVLPPTPKNKALDMATWSKGSTFTPRSASPASAFLQTPRLNQASSSPNSPFVPSSPAVSSFSPSPSGNDELTHSRTLSLEDYSERMRTAAIMLAQLNANLVREPVTTIAPSGGNSGPSNPAAPGPSWSAGALNWIPGSGWITGARGRSGSDAPPPGQAPTRMKLQFSEAAAIREKIMQEMMSLEEERMERMKETAEDVVTVGIGERQVSAQTAEDEGIVRRELNKVDPSAAVFRESWVSKKARIRAGSPYGHLASWDCLSVIVKTGADLRQEQMAVQLIQIFGQIWKQEECACWVRHFRILITGSSSGLVETIKDAVSIHSIKKAEYARRLAEGRFGHVTLLDHFIASYGDVSSAKFARAQRCFARSLAGYSLITYLLQIKDRHNGNILLDREGHLIHIDFGFILSNSPGNMGFEAAPFKFPLEYVEVLGGVDSEPFKEFKRLFREGFEAARKHCDNIITIVELMQKDSALPCFAAFGEQTSQLLRDRFQQNLPHALIGDHVDRLIMSSMGSAWTRLYDSFQYYSQSIL